MTKQQTYMVQIIYADGSFEDRYVTARTGCEAIKKVEATVSASARRWARFVA